MLFIEPTYSFVVSTILQIDVGNPTILEQHTLCASAELPVEDGDDLYFGPRLANAVRALMTEGLVAKHPHSLGNNAVSRCFGYRNTITRLKHVHVCALHVLCCMQAPPTVGHKSHPSTPCWSDNINCDTVSHVTSKNTLQLMH